MKATTIPVQKVKKEFLIFSFALIDIICLYVYLNANNQLNLSEIYAQVGYITVLTLLFYFISIVFRLGLKELLKK